MRVRIWLGSVACAAMLTLVVGCSAEPDKTGGQGRSGSAGSTSTGGSGGTGGSSGTGGSGTGGAGTAGASSGGSAGAPADASTGRPTELPNSDSQADIAAFIESGGYKRLPWISETAMPREGTLGTQHASKVRVWENAPLVASLKGGRDGRMNHPYPDQWSMAVKELYDETSGEFVGAAVSFKTAGGADFGAWTYYCYGPSNRCSSGGPATKDMPVYGKGSTTPGSNCGFCHGFSVYHSTLIGWGGLPSHFHRHSPIHSPQTHWALQVRICFKRLMRHPRSCVSPGTHSPSFWQISQLPHPHCTLQTRACVPHLPQVSRSTSLGAQSFWSMHFEKGVHFDPPSVA